MVGMSGTEVLREILETGRLSDDTVVVMSAHPSEEVEDELRKARAKDVTDKPVRLRLLREALSELKLRQ